ncbi:MAG: MerR family transcriptional regulator [Alphaproteobacteria bacterium]|nr:MerR family transcriptional regulator [Alphaproteobacteria bacterium]
MVVNKSKSAFKTIAEVAEELGVATHVLRFWETKFSQIKPMKATGGRRYYRPDDVEVLKLIQNLLYQKRYTIEGAQQLIKEKGLKNLLGGNEIQKDFFEEPLINDDLPAPIIEEKEEKIFNIIEVKKAIEELKILRKKLSEIK